MFGLTGMVDNYDSRKVGRYEKKELTVSTVKVTDSTKPYETAVGHKRYNKGDWVIVELYDSLESATEGHKRWIKKMTAKVLPDSLQNVSTAKAALLADTGGKTWRKYEKSNLKGK